MPEDWELLRDGAAKIAEQRLASTHQIVTTAVTQFYEEAKKQIEHIEAPAEHGLGMEMFKVFTDIMMLAFPEEAVVEKVAGEAIKAFRDVTVEGVQKAANATVAKHWSNAKDQLEETLKDLADSARDSAKAGWSTAHYKLETSLNGFFDSNPNYKQLDYNANANQLEAWVVDRIGIPDPLSAGYDLKITTDLWHAFNQALAKAVWHAKMLDAPVIERRSLEYARWEQLSPHEKVEELAKLDVHAREQLLHGGPMFANPDEVKTWLQIAELWSNPMTRGIAEAELAVLTGS